MSIVIQQCYIETVADSGGCGVWINLYWNLHAVKYCITSEKAV